LILGKPTAFGTYKFRVKVNDGRRTATQDFTLPVQPRFALVAGEFRGRPQVAGTFRVGITVTGHDRVHSTKTFVLVIRR
jgi:hypothetical protein